MNRKNNFFSFIIIFNVVVISMALMFSVIKIESSLIHIISFLISLIVLPNIIYILMSKTNHVFLNK